MNEPTPTPNQPGEPATDQRAKLSIPDAAERVGWVLRLALLLLTALLTFATTRSVGSLVWVSLLAVAALPAWTPPHHHLLAPLGRLAEVTVTIIGASTLAAAHSGAAASALLPYITVPIILPAMEGRLRESMALLAYSSVGLVVAGAADGLLGQPSYLLSGVEWIGIAGLSAAFVHSVQRLAAVAEPGPPPYAEATRLLTQLRTVARQLPGATLDPGGIAEHLIEEVRAIAHADRAVVLSDSGGGRLVVLAQAGVDRADWETSLNTDSAIADAWASQVAQVTTRSQSRSTARGRETSAVVLPLIAGVRTIGLVVLEADRSGAYPPALVSQLTACVITAALRLEAALLFDDVRSLATNEERQRLAREIHDGVAQELVMVGYGIDNALATLPADAGETTEELRTVRGEVTRVINELRLSLFELRSEVDRQRRLGRGDRRVRAHCRRRGRHAGALLTRGVDSPTARRRRGGTAAHRPGGDHQRPQARRGAEPVGQL